MNEEQRFRDIFVRAHADHRACANDEWLGAACEQTDGSPAHPVVWSRRNGPWRRVDILWVGAAPGNAGGKGQGDQGAHGTRIPFGGDIAGANLDALLGSIGIDRNETFLVAALNQLPVAGGGEPTLQELLAPVGEFANSIELLRDTIVATGPGLIVTLGHVGLRATAAALTRDVTKPTLPTICKLERAGIERGKLSAWPPEPALSTSFVHAWREAWGEQQPSLWVLPIMHPSGQNMSPYPRRETAFHTRMVDARNALRDAVSARFGWRPPADRARPDDRGIYQLPEWRTRVAARHEELDALWRAHGI